MAWTKLVAVCAVHWDVPPRFSLGIKDLAASSAESRQFSAALSSQLLSGNASAEESYFAQGSCPFPGMAHVQ